MNRWRASKLIQSLRDQSTAWVGRIAAAAEKNRQGAECKFVWSWFAHHTNCSKCLLLLWRAQLKHYSSKGVWRDHESMLHYITLHKLSWLRPIKQKRYVKVQKLVVGLIEQQRYTKVQKLVLGLIEQHCISSQLVVGLIEAPSSEKCKPALFSCGRR